MILKIGNKRDGGGVKETIENCVDAKEKIKKLFYFKRRGNKGAKRSKNPLILRPRIYGNIIY